MKHYHLAHCPSTQEHIKRLLSANPKIKEMLVSTDQQISGRGRGRNQWHHFKNSLAFSFTLPPSPVWTLTSLEMAIHLCQILQQKTKSQLGVKWPNDIINSEGKKCGGIILQSHNQESLLCGMGINIVPSDDDLAARDLGFNFGFVGTKDLPKGFREDWPVAIAHHIFGHRLSALEIMAKWNSLCVHLNKPISFQDGDNKFKGVFKGIGKKGEAIIEQEDGKKCTKLTGSLFIS